ncbi:MAG: 5-methyltetrahydropteroyltriglutamate--homocysteine S-methyltransferase [Defluviicoccus sp.]|nr:5-methyltetrahydropteroyltriglutamate--homocysteine S-methyltransferase [Defluviicoccus sp.]
MGTPPFRADHVGSLLRPEKLKAARDRREGDHHTRVSESRRFDELREIEDEAIVEAIALQESVGLRTVTDGEFRRRSWWQDFVLELDGTYIDFAEFAIEFTDPQGNRLPAPVAHVDGKIRRSRPINRDSFLFLKNRSRGVVKVTMPSPPIVHFFGGRLAVDESAYPDLDEFWSDLARAYREEIADLAEAGCSYVQLDECILALMCDPKFRVQLQARGDDPDSLLKSYVRVINDALSSRPDGMFVSMHLCRGNNRGHWLGEGGYDYISDVLFNEIDVDAYFMEYDSSRAGDFGPLAGLPQGKTVVLGLVTAKSPELEDPDALKRRIDDAARLTPLERLALSPQCGFASHFLGNPLTGDDQRRKLDLVVRVAEDVWS